MLQELHSPSHKQATTPCQAYNPLKEPEPFFILSTNQGKKNRANYPVSED